MKKNVIIIAGLLLLLAFAQCTKDKEKEQNIQLTNEAIEYIEDNIQSQLDLLADKDIPEMLQALADWALNQEGVQTDSIDENCVVITFVDGTISEIEIVDCTINDPDFNFPSSRSMSGNVVQFDNKDIPIGGSKVFIWDPFPDFIRFEDDENHVYEQAEYINHMFEDIANVMFLQGDQCTVDALRDLTNYAYVHIASHGSRRAFATGERVLDPNKYRQERDDNRVITKFLTYKIVDNIEYKGNFYGVTNKFIDALEGRFNNALVINASCSGLPLIRPLLCRSFRNKGAATYCGFDKSVNNVFSHFVATDMITYMYLYYNSGQAYEKVTSNYPSYNNGFLEGKVRFRMDGAEDLSLYQIPPIPSEGLVAYYPFNGNANDESGNGNNGILSGNNVPAISTDRHGNPNSAYEFGGYYNPNWIRVPNSESLQFEHEMTISFWIQQCELAGMDGWGNYSTTGPGFAAICKAGDGNATYPGLFIMTGIGEDGQGLHISCNNSNGNAHNHDAWNFNINAEISDFELCDWVNVTLVVSDEFKAFYINGIFAGMDEVNKPSDFTYMNQQDLFIGVMGDDNPTFGGYGGGYWYHFYGKIDDIRIYNRALNTSEILALYKE